MPGRGDARRAMDVAADVALLGEQGRAGVQSDPHLDLPRAEHRSDRTRRSERTRRGAEREEEGVALSVHLDPAVPRAGLADHSPVLGQCLRVGLAAEFVQELRRPLNVSEEEGDGAGRKVLSHNAIICGAEARVQSQSFERGSRWASVLSLKAQEPSLRTGVLGGRPFCSPEQASPTPLLEVAQAEGHQLQLRDGSRDDTRGRRHHRADSNA